MLGRKEETQKWLCPAEWAAEILWPGTPGLAFPFNLKEPGNFSTLPPGIHSLLSLSLIILWVGLAPNLGPRFLLWEGPREYRLLLEPQTPFLELDCMGIPQVSGSKMPSQVGREDALSLGSLRVSKIALERGDYHQERGK